MAHPYRLPENIHYPILLRYARTRLPRAKYEHNRVLTLVQNMRIRFILLVAQGAQQHHAPSMMYLGKVCLFGHGFPVDYDMALLWFERAAMEVKGGGSVFIQPPRFPS